MINQDREGVERRQREGVEFAQYQFCRWGWMVGTPLQRRKNVDQRPRVRRKWSSDKGWDTGAMAPRVE